MIDTPPFPPPYKTLTKTATGITIIETLADGSTRALGEMPLSTLPAIEQPASAVKQSTKKTASRPEKSSGNEKAAVYLNVPFDEKDKAKSKGARWDATKKKWYAPHGIDLNLFKAWWPDSLK